MGFCLVTHITNTILEDNGDMSPVIQTETKTHCLELFCYNRGFHILILDRLVWKMYQSDDQTPQIQEENGTETSAMCSIY